MTETLNIHVGTPNRSNIADRLERIDNGEVVEPQPARLSIESLDVFGRIFRPTNIELLNAIQEHEPGSIRELARIVERHPPEVTQNVTELAEYGLIELVDDGRAKRPVVWYDEIEFSGDVLLQDMASNHGPSVAP